MSSKPKTYSTGKSLRSHEVNKHPRNHVVPHSSEFELPSSWCLCQFRSVFLANVKSCLYTHWSAQGLKQFTIHCHENLFYYVFYQELGEKKTKTGSVVKVATERKDPETQKMIQTEFGFFWEERTTKEEHNEKTYTWSYGLLKFTK
ncbi:15369_t:CDS:2, partial [Cetraspora pellucida]